jgi:hypothetical protein
VVHEGRRHGKRQPSHGLLDVGAWSWLYLKLNSSGATRTLPTARRRAGLGN